MLQRILVFTVLTSSTTVLAADVNTIAGNGIAGFNGDGLPALSTELRTPRGLAVAADGTVYFADSQNFRIRSVTPTNIVTTVAGTGAPGDTGDGFPATSATFGTVFNVALDPTDTLLYFADNDHNRVRVVNLVTGKITNFAGNPNATDLGDGGLATAASLAFPTGIATGPDGSVYIADTADCIVRKVDPTGFITTVAGDINCSTVGIGTPPTTVGFFSPIRVAVDAGNNLFVLDSGADTIFRVAASDGTVTNVAGGGGQPATLGPAAGMNLGTPTDIAVSASGLLFITNATQAYQVADVTTDDTLSVFAGTAGATGFTGDGGPATSALFDGLTGVTVRGDSVWLSDSINARIRAITPQTLVDLLVDATTDQQLLDTLNAVPGSVIMLTVNGRTELIMPNLQSVGVNVTADSVSPLLVIDLGALQSVGGSIDISGDLSLTSVSLPNLTTVGGDLNIANNTNLSTVLISGITSIGGNLTLIGNAATVIDVGALTSVSGSVTIDNETSATTISAGSLATVSGSVSISGDTAATTIDAGALTTVGGSVSISGDTSATTIGVGSLTTISGSTSFVGDTSVTSVSAPLLTSSGSVTISGDTSATTIDAASLTTVSGSVTITGDTSATTVDVGSLSTVSGDVTIVNNGDTTVNAGSLTDVSGNVTIDSTGSGTFAAGSNVTVSGSTSLTTSGYSVVSGTTAIGSTSVTAITLDATLNLQISSASFSSPTQFTLTELSSAALVPQTGTASDGSTATIDPVVGYQFNFTTPTLNPGAPATLSFNVNLSGLSSADQSELLNAVLSGTATIVTQPDAPGSTYQALALCSASQTVADGCVTVQNLDAAGNPTTGTPSSILFTAQVTHFSNWAVGVVTPSATCPAPSTDLCTDQTGFTSSYTQTVVRNPGADFVLNQTFSATAGTATVVVHNDGCQAGDVILNGTTVLDSTELLSNGTCYQGTVDLQSSNTISVTLTAVGGTAQTASLIRPKVNHDHHGDISDHHGDGDGDGHGHRPCHHHPPGNAWGWDKDHDDCDDDGGEGEGEGAVGEGEGEGAVGEGEGEGEGAVGEGEGEGAVGEGEGEGSPAGEGEGEGAGTTDTGCTITITVEQVTPCDSSGATAATSTTGASCASSGTAPAAFGILALGLLLRRRRR